jgi:hypothetical protein
LFIASIPYKDLVPSLWYTAVPITGVGWPQRDSRSTAEFGIITIDDDYDDGGAGSDDDSPDYNAFYR